MKSTFKQKYQIPDRSFRPKCTVFWVRYALYLMAFGTSCASHAIVTAEPIWLDTHAPTANPAPSDPPNPSKEKNWMRLFSEAK